MKIGDLTDKTAAEMYEAICNAVVGTMRENYDLLRYEPEYGSLHEKISGALNKALKINNLFHTEYLHKAPKEEIIKRYSEYADIFISLVKYLEELNKLIERKIEYHS